MPSKNIKVTPYAKLLIAKKFYPRQVQTVSGHVKNPQASLWAQIRKGQ